MSRSGEMAMFGSRVLVGEYRQSQYFGGSLWRQSQRQRVVCWWHLSRIVLVACLGEEGSFLGVVGRWWELLRRVFVARVR